ncbi:MAG: hypothetical protein K5686_02890 [Lachnospiraceae bacterium]|nr:hypothetical protein [Lachnospiraceae bacterium]
MYSIAHIIAYFTRETGKWPDYIDWFMASCKANPTIDFYIFTDDHALAKWEDTPNINIVYMSYEECVALIHEKVGYVNMTKTRKLCDIKPVYGKVFREWVKDYDFWAFGDCDLILGDLRKNFPDEFLDKYDWLQVLGNLEIVRNTEEVNDYYLMERPDWSLNKDFTWKSIVEKENETGFDEWIGVPMIIRENGKRIYWTRENFANIYQERKGYKKMIDNTVQENTLFQYWRWENGALYHVNKLTGKKKERLYIHFSNRKMKAVPYTGQDSIYITACSEIKEDCSWKDTFCGWDFFRVYAKKIKVYIIWHLKHPHGKDKAEA